MIDALNRAREYLAQQAPFFADDPKGWPDAMRILAALVAEIEGAPAGVVDRMGDDEDGNPRIIVGMTRIEIRDMPNVMFKRVRLLALDSGGAGEVGGG